MKLTGLYAGLPRVLEPSGQRSGILKSPVARATVTREGIVGDGQADRRYHGGGDKALHQYAVASYATIVERHPGLVDVARPGSIGENLSCPDLDEQSVCIGDRYRIGRIEVQVTQPRSPCWKIDARYGVPGLARFVVERRIPGWYLRVLTEGAVAAGDDIVLVARPNPEVTLARFLAIVGEHRPALVDLRLLAGCAGLSADWRRRLRERLDFRMRDAKGSLPGGARIPPA